ncbi:nicotinate-nucleotide adenylyltransferase [Colwellia echini]|uniref:Probable nicotinate-nucleotide adenylyltransferase n=2 Tax=Colwellia echini TaxID=1982103 RepID=A0ABY3MT61_9GAMM|nr:nicotinate-nucleotide adenylyltransferase [Colwellia echini]
MRVAPILSSSHSRATTFKASINKSKKRGLGILGGSFDPIHLGHTQSAQAVAKELALSEVLLIPAYISPLKTTPDLVPHASAKQRAEMVEMACQSNELFSCDTQELSRAGHSYTVDTLKALKESHPNHILYFIIGMDSLITFTQWQDYQQILTLCHLVVNTRPEHDLSQLDNHTKKLLSQHQINDKEVLSTLDSGKIFFADPVYYDISSTQIRQRIAQQQSCEKLLTPIITDYIKKNNLYR